MSDGAISSDEPSVRLILRPHRSLSATGFLVLMGVIAGISFATGLVFLLLGAWPVLFFCGLDVLAIYVAFRLNYRSGRAAELVEIDGALLALTRWHPSGREERIELNPYWVRVRLAELRDGRTDLRLASHGREVSLGRFLTDDERRDVAAVLRDALARNRGRAGGYA